MDLIGRASLGWRAAASRLLVARRRNCFGADGRKGSEGGEGRTPKINNLELSALPCTHSTLILAREEHGLGHQAIVSAAAS